MTAVDEQFLSRLLAAMDAFGHPTRLRFMLACQEAEGGRLSPNGYRRDSARYVGESLGTVAYHVRTLSKEGLIRKAGSRQVRGATEHFYRLTERGEQLLEKVVGAAS